MVKKSAAHAPRALLRARRPLHAARSMTAGGRVEELLPERTGGTRAVARLGTPPTGLKLTQPCRFDDRAAATA